jgi:septum site-determining protein MinC
MSVKPSGQSPLRSNVSFEIKSAQLPLVALLFKSHHWNDIAADLHQQFGAAGENPEFFDQDPVVLDFSALVRDSQWDDVDTVLQALRACRLVPLAFRGEPAHWTKPLLQAGLISGPVEISQLGSLVKSPAAPVVATVREVPGPGTMVIDKPIRSGQKIYARGGDLVLLAMVNAGAEVVADGNIHVYAPLRGKAMAGARGNAAARIFSLCLEPELISIAGVYRTSETPLPGDVAGKPAQVRLFSEDGQDKLLIEPLKT